MVAAAGARLDGDLSTEHSWDCAPGAWGKGRWARPHPLAPVSIHGRFLWGQRSPVLSDVLAFGVGWRGLPPAALREGFGQKAWMGCWPCQGHPPVRGAVPKSYGWNWGLHWGGVMWTSRVSALRRNFRFLTLAPQDPSCLAQAHPHQPHLTSLSPSLASSLGSSKGPCSFLPLVLCTFSSMCLKCFSLTLDLLMDQTSPSSNVSSSGEPWALS